MSLSFAIAIYVVIWWTVLFAILPIGVRTQGEDGAVVPGTPESAPTRAAACCAWRCSPRSYRLWCSRGLWAARPVRQRRRPGDLARPQRPQLSPKTK